MPTAQLASAYLCTRPADNQVIVFGCMTDGPHDLSWDEPLRPGATIIVRGFRPLAYTGLAVAGGVLVEWDDGMCLLFADATLPNGLHDARPDDFPGFGEPVAPPAQDIAAA